MFKVNARFSIYKISLRSTCKEEDINCQCDTFGFKAVWELISPKLMSNFQNQLKQRQGRSSKKCPLAEVKHPHYCSDPGQKLKKIYEKTPKVMAAYFEELVALEQTQGDRLGFATL